MTVPARSFAAMPGRSQCFGRLLAASRTDDAVVVVRHRELEREVALERPPNVGRLHRLAVGVADVRSQLERVRPPAVRRGRAATSRGRARAASRRARSPGCTRRARRPSCAGSPTRSSRRRCAVSIESVVRPMRTTSVPPRWPAPDWRTPTSTSPPRMPTPCGRLPTSMRFTTSFVRGSMRDSVPSNWLLTQTPRRAGGERRHAVPDGDGRDRVRDRIDPRDRPVQAVRDPDLPVRRRRCRSARCPTGIVPHDLAGARIDPHHAVRRLARSPTAPCLPTASSVAAIGSVFRLSAAGVDPRDRAVAGVRDPDRPVVRRRRRPGRCRRGSSARPCSSPGRSRTPCRPGCWRPRRRRCRRRSRSAGSRRRSCPPPALVAGSIRETVLSSAFVTQAAPSPTATWLGVAPTAPRR